MSVTEQQGFWMNPDEAAFRRAIAADPLAALPRLAFADYLEEEGQAERAGAMREAVPRLLALNLELVRVPAGTFWMGAPDADEWADDDERPQHQVTITRGFLIGKYPVTQGQWRAVMGTNPSWFSRDGGGNYRITDLSDEEVGRLPVEKVSWDDVGVFLDALNELEQKAGGGLVYRLPSEAEWEYACRGGAISREDCSHRYYFARPVDRLTRRRANYKVNVGRTTAVGSYPGNRLGVHDMHGNVWEWCRDAYDDRAYGDGMPRTDPCLEGGPLRVYRGGCWLSVGDNCSASCRGRVEPTRAVRVLGFRTLAVPAGQE